MKSRVYVWVLMCMLVVLGGCKAKESAYKQVYETAQARPTVSQTPTPTPTTTTVNGSNQVAERPTTPAYDYFQEERVTAMDGRTLRQYSVVVGSFINRTNAESLRNRMQAEGYSPLVAQNEKGMYRVIVASFDTRSEALAQRDAIKRRHPEFYDAWLLNRVY